MLTEVTLPVFEGDPVTGEVLELPAESVEPVGIVEPVESVEKAVFVDCIPLASEPTPLPHPEPQKAKLIKKMKNKKNGKLCGCR